MLGKLIIQQQVFKILKDNLSEIIENNGLRTDTGEIYDFLLRSGYQALPFLVRALIKEEVFVDTIKNNSNKVNNIIKDILKK